MYLTNESKIIIQYINKFEKKKIIFSGNIQDQFFLHILSKEHKIHMQKCYYNDSLKENFNKNICFRMIPRKNFFKNCNTLIFFWIRNKIELIFQLTYILSNFLKKKEIFIIGKNKFGINSIKNILHYWIDLKKINYKKKCSLYYGTIKKIPKFNLKMFFRKHIVHNTTIVTLPGVFDYNKIDLGSKIIINSFKEKNTGKVLDIGSGSGILSAVLKKFSPLAKITLVDNNSTALFCSKYTLRMNKMEGKVYYSNIFSNIHGKFNLIISNPPTHYGNFNNLNIIYKIIKEAKNFLYRNGKLRMVIHSNISCKKKFIEFFGNYKILKKKKHFNLYEATYIV